MTGIRPCPGGEPDGNVTEQKLLPSMKMSAILWQSGGRATTASVPRVLSTTGPDPRLPAPIQFDCCPRREMGHGSAPFAHRNRQYNEKRIKSRKNQGSKKRGRRI
jgi:hypothetical protein